LLVTTKSPKHDNFESFVHNESAIPEKKKNTYLPFSMNDGHSV
jgi:hypothetical protein